MIDRIRVHPSGQGLYEFTRELSTCVSQAEIESGLCTAFVQHTSASLVIQENADPSVQQDLERWLARLVPEQDALYTHTQEGPDDMPAHVKASLMGCSLSIPVQSGRLALGTWQGIYLCEHRNRATGRQLILTLMGQAN